MPLARSVTRSAPALFEYVANSVAHTHTRARARDYFLAIKRALTYRRYEKSTVYNLKNARGYMRRTAWLGRHLSINPDTWKPVTRMKRYTLVHQCSTRAHACEQGTADNNGTRGNRLYLRCCGATTRSPYRRRRHVYFHFFSIASAPRRTRKTRKKCAAR